MIKTDFMTLCQEKSNQRRAGEYSAQVKKQRKIRRIRKAVTGILVAVFFVGAFGLVGASEMESEILAKERETSQMIRNGKIKYRNLIETEEGYLWKADVDYPEGTEVTVTFNDNGTANPIDDVVLYVTER